MVVGGIRLHPVRRGNERLQRPVEIDHVDEVALTELNT